MKAFYQNTETLKWEIIDSLDNLLQLAPGGYKLKTNIGKTHVWIFEGANSIGSALVTDVIKNPNGDKYTDFDDLDIATKDFFADAAQEAALKVAELELSKQDLLISEENIKTVNGQSLLGAGNITITGSGGSSTYEIWGYVATWAELPLGITETDPIVGDLVGVNTDTGISVFGIGNKRYKGFYKRIDTTGVATTDYGTSPFVGFPMQADQATVDAGTDDTQFVTPLTLKNNPNTHSAETPSTIGALIETTELTTITDTTKIAGSVSGVVNWFSGLRIKEFLSGYFAPNTTQEETYSYGIRIDTNFSSPIVNRIGNIELHKTLPIQSLMKGCLLKDDGTVNYYLYPTDWTKKADGVTASKLDGTDGQVMVEIPSYYEKNTQLNQFQFEKRISTIALNGYTLIAKKYIGAYKASLQHSTSKLASVVNLTTDYRGGNNNAYYDALSNTFLGKPVSNTSITDFRIYARNRAANTRWNCITYELRKSLYWLFVIEYANLNSQTAVTAKDTVTGLMQGGLGDGFTTANGTEWGNFNGYYPSCPCGVSNSLANSSGEVNFTINDFGGTGVNRTFKANRYRGIENPFGDISEWTDGVLIDVKTDANGGTFNLYTSDNPTNFNDSILTNYTNRGLIARTEGWVKSMMLGVGADLLPINVVGGSSSTYFGDYFYRNIDSSVVRGVIFGGSAYDGSNAGLVCANTRYSPTNVNSVTGSRLCFM